MSAEQPSALSRVGAGLAGLARGLNPWAVRARPATEEEVSRAARLFFYLCGAMVTGFILWACYFELDVVSEAEGEIIPSTRVKRVQHLEGGIIMDILVKEGDPVKQDQELLVLESTASDSSKEEVEVRVASLTAEIARLQAELQDLPAPVFPPELVARAGDMVDQARKLFLARKARVDNELAAQRGEVRQKEQLINEISARLRNNKRGLEILREQIAISADLLKDQLTTKYKHLSFLQEESTLKSRIEEDGAALSRAEAGLAGEKEKLTKVTSLFKENAREDLRKASRELEEFNQRLRKYADTLLRMVIRSPVDGVVKTMYVVNVGEVIKPGTTIMDIVPGGDRLVVEAHLPVRDIGYVQVGQQAVVKLASRDSSRYGSLAGWVRGVSPDAVTMPSSMPGGASRTYYRVLVMTDQDHFQRGHNRYNLYPGVQVTAGILVGRRTVMEYLLEPFLQTFGYSLHEL